MREITKSFSELTTDELYSILKIRTEVFVVEQDCPYQECDGKDQNSLHHWLETDSGEIAAYVRICAPGVSYKEPSIGRVLVNTAYRKQNLGRRIMRSSMQLCKATFSVGTIRISAQEYLLDFYTSLGFEATKKKYLEDGIPHVEMLKNK